ncbi:hypothetical protein KJ975_03945 [Myxococcota bacterium]|nr:hypothetical protein [Myxococcota bacterium]
MGLLLLLVITVGCSEDLTSLRNFVLEEPAFCTYDSSRLPRGQWPAEYATITEAADALTPPLSLSGPDTGEDGIIYAAALGGYYLMKVQRSDGGFGYQYDLRTGTWADDDEIHRQCGSTFTQAMLAELTGRPEFSLSTEWALRWITPQVTQQADGSASLADLGGTALLLLSLTSHAQQTGDSSRDGLIDQLGLYLLRSIGEGGLFTRGGALQWGQALQALGRLHEITGDVRYLDAMESTGYWLYLHPERSYEATDEGYLMSLWVADPLLRLYAQRPLEWIPEYLFRLTDPIVASQHLPHNTGDLEKLGHYVCPEAGGGATWRTALRLEGVVDGYRLAVLRGDTERALTYRESTLFALYALQKLQLRAGDTRGAVDPVLVEGAWPQTPDGRTLRADVTHHTANTLLKAALYLELEGIERE